MCVCVCARRAHLEASAERVTGLLSQLEDLWAWLCLKEEELNKQMPVGGDVPTLLQQQKHCTVHTHTHTHTLSVMAQ